MASKLSTPIVNSPLLGTIINLAVTQIIYRCRKAPAGEQGGASVGGKREHEIVLTPLEFIARIAALMPLPRQHRRRYYGVLASNPPQRGQVTPLPNPQVALSECDATTRPSPTDPASRTRVSAAHHQSRYIWAKLIARVFDTDPLLCGRCGGRMKIIAFVVQASEIKKTLAHLRLPTNTPKFHPARAPPQSDFWDSATASEWGVDPTYPDAADQDQSMPCKHFEYRN
jgi:Putative transposase